jgi:hypothetical protein
VFKSFLFFDHTTVPRSICASSSCDLPALDGYQTLRRAGPR